MNEVKNKKLTLTQLIDKLPLYSKQLLSLYYVEELNIKEISLVLQIGENVVKDKLNKLIVNLNRNTCDHSLNLKLI